MTLHQVSRSCYNAGEGETMMHHFAAAVTAAFNLVCSGTRTVESYHGGRQVEPYSSVYRIDLDQRKWCEGDCEGGASAIAEVDAKRIVLRPDKKTDTISEREDAASWINRETGEERSWRVTGRDLSTVTIERRATCVKRPFTGFAGPRAPATKF